VRGVTIEILGREMTGDALVIPEGATPLVGHIVLQHLDLIVDAGGEQILPRDPRGRMAELLSVA
jgi:hypothetical protein